MPSLELKAELTGKGAVNSSYIYLERLPEVDQPNAIPIGLKAKNSARKEWTNSSIHLLVHGDIELQLNVHAIMGTGWNFKLSNKVGTKWKTLYETDGTTGEDPAQGINVSIVRTSVSLTNNNNNA